MLVSDMITRVRNEIGEPPVTGEMGQQSGTWSDTQIMGYLNDAQNLVAKVSRIQADPYTVTLQSGVNTYSLPNDCLEDGIRKIMWTESGGTVEVDDVGLDRWAELNADETNYVQPPMEAMVYCQWANKIRLFPTPQTTGDTLTVYYYKYPTTLTSVNDTSIVPSRFHMALVKYAVAECQAAVEETALSQVAMQRYEAIMSQLTSERSTENRDRPARVRVRL